ncbi:alpha-ketoglutarate-dependent dioxygenase AlkB [Pontibacterium granulatum]|uniref:alpha-ketoglutarate-dependent dioxygenase AlkB family protein n=1 Tax=Pontibacterium granulatum TaxID=2036029 RepID=UPI00249BD240|nr:alpha-ketoglutarate-dependent dioxygenase AlkB [Pontibacterium granulatum]MDI3323315.1 alpha-ketoglutarate-dependent dioxygenase AlkB [Pontibacterium granulatum]
MNLIPPDTIDMQDGELIYDANFLNGIEADNLLHTLTDEVNWRQDCIRLFGKEHLIPRLQCFQGDPGISYLYSNLKLDAESWHPALQQLKNRLVEPCGTNFNAVLLNLYRNGQDSMGWHSDDEPELGQNPTIASISLGEERRFLLRRKDEHNLKREIVLQHGSLLVMRGTLQHFWQHSVPRTQKPRKPRINLTFRHVL